MVSLTGRKGIYTGQDRLTPSVVRTGSIAGPLVRSAEELALDWRRMTNSISLFAGFVVESSGGRDVA